MDAIALDKGKPREVTHLIAAYYSALKHSNRPKPTEVEFHISACRMVPLASEEVTPAGAVTSLAVSLMGFLLDTRYPYRLYLVEPYEVKLFSEALSGVPGGVVLTPLVHVKLQPQVILTREDDDHPSVVVMLGRLHDVDRIAHLLGL